MGDGMSDSDASREHWRKKREAKRKLEEEKIAKTPIPEALKPFIRHIKEPVYKLAVADFYGLKASCKHSDCFGQVMMSRNPANHWFLRKNGMNCNSCSQEYMLVSDLEGFELEHALRFSK